MTITEQQLDAVLPRTPAGLALASLDPTDDGDRHRIIADLLDLYRRAESQSAPTRQTTPENAAHVHWGVSEATVGWPPPKPGTHEHDEWKRRGMPSNWGSGTHGTNFAEYDRAAAWSRENAR